jgi:hypothetical protein
MVVRSKPVPTKPYAKLAQPKIEALREMLASIDKAVEDNHGNLGAAKAVLQLLRDRKQFAKHLDWWERLAVTERPDPKFPPLKSRRVH